MRLRPRRLHLDGDVRPCDSAGAATSIRRELLARRSAVSGRAGRASPSPAPRPRRRRGGRHRRALRRSSRRPTRRDRRNGYAATNVVRTTTGKARQSSPSRAAELGGTARPARSDVERYRDRRVVLLLRERLVLGVIAVAVAIATAGETRIRARDGTGSMGRRQDLRLRIALRSSRSRTYIQGAEPPTPLGVWAAQCFSPESHPEGDTRWWQRRRRAARRRAHPQSRRWCPCGRRRPPPAVRRDHLLAHLQVSAGWPSAEHRSSASELPLIHQP